MPKTLTILGQEAMDLTLRAFRVQTDFFTLDDYIAAGGSVLGDFYRQEWEREYARMRVDGELDGVIAFSPNLLIEQELEVTKKTDGWYAELTLPIFTFLYDKQNSGLQNVFPIVPEGCELERSNVNETWQYKYMPESCRIFWRTDGEKIHFYTNGNVNVSKIRILYVPGITADALVPDTLASMVVDGAVNKIKGLPQQVVKQTNDNNYNKVMETELNKEALKP